MTELIAGVADYILQLSCQLTRQDVDRLLAPVQELASRIESQGIMVLAVDRFSDRAKAVFDCSFATILPDGKKAIVLEKASIQQVADASATTYRQCLEATLAHEYGHLCGFESETQAWDSVRTSPNLDGAALNRIRNYILLGQCYSDTRQDYPAWVARFDELSAALGAETAWAATAGDRASLTFDEIRHQLIESGWSFDAAWECSNGSPAKGLTLRSIQTGNLREAARIS